MTNKEQILHELNAIPETFLPEVLHFVQVLKNRNPSEKMAATALSEASLSKDWMRPEENEAWQHL